MTPTTHLRRLGALLDRLPAAERIAITGIFLQTALAVGLFAAGYAGGDRVGALVAAVLLAVAVLAGVAALPAVLLWRLDRSPRLAAALATLVGLGTLVFNEAHVTVWPVSVALVLAAGRAWAGTRLDATDLLALDPGRFERVQPPRHNTEEADGAAAGDTEHDTRKD
ncbi:hypothetical protein [Halorientalis regularis]|uniref:Uncharacterized protein n=1 Tax=Halorientalis regularis TaxID=660518 RepID=A0A1G7GXE7_9EURY|nr:hypothetical protein [Halorientalis regularis]SDE92816.1 hypothetical protein SAMN05216218_102226 [Halorientalis regularis]